MIRDCAAIVELEFSKDTPKSIINRTIDEVTRHWPLVVGNENDGQYTLIGMLQLQDSEFARRVAPCIRDVVWTVAGRFVHIEASAVHIEDYVPCKEILFAREEYDKFLLAEEDMKDFRPRTELGKRLLEIRKHAIRTGELYRSYTKQPKDGDEPPSALPQGGCYYMDVWLSFPQDTDESLIDDVISSTSAAYSLALDDEYTDTGHRCYILTGWAWLRADDSDESFALRLSATVWRTAKTFVEIAMRAVCLADLPRITLVFDTTEYEKFLRDRGVSYEQVLQNRR